MVKLVKFKGPFTWHKHDNEDEMFLVAKGSFNMELRDQTAAEIEAATSLADLAKDVSPLDERHHMAVEVRTKSGPLFQAAFIYDAGPHKR